jgi:hypothetical protein
MEGGLRTEGRARPGEESLQDSVARAGLYIPTRRGIEASSVAGYLEGLQDCWRRLEQMQESETEKALCRMQARKLEIKIRLWKEASDVDEC